MNYDEAAEWMRGERSTTNMIPHDPHESWLVRITVADAAMKEQAYWTLKAWHEGIVPSASSKCQIVWTCRHCCKVNTWNWEPDSILTGSTSMECDYCDKLTDGDMDNAGKFTAAQQDEAKGSP